MKSRVDTLTRLAADHARVADQIRTLKKLGEEAASSCDRTTPPKDCNPAQMMRFMSASDCIQEAFNAFKGGLSEGADHSFEEVWSDMVCENEICLPCQRVRTLKADRMKARTRLGAIRAAITRVGRSINRENQR